MNSGKRVRCYFSHIQEQTTEIMKEYADCHYKKDYLGEYEDDSDNKSKVNYNCTVSFENEVERRLISLTHYCLSLREA